MAGARGNWRSGHPRQAFVGVKDANASAGDAARDGTPGKLSPNAQAAGEFRALARTLLFHGRCGPPP